MIIRHLTFDSADPFKLATFWSAATGWKISAADAPGDDEVLLEAPAPFPGLLFIQVPEAKTVKNRVHFDWMPDTRTRDQQVAHLLSLGATLHEDHRTPEGLGWVTLLDPEGNEFCVERGTGERGM